MTENDPQNEQPSDVEHEGAEQEGAEQEAPTLPSRSRNPLSQDKDFVARPGFRNPSNKRTKAQKSAKKKR